MFVYIAAPYTSSFNDVVSKRSQEDRRYETIEHYMVKVFNQGNIALSPVIHCRDLALRHRMPTTYDFWQTYCEETLKLISKDERSEVHVLMMEGWESSVGVKHEVEVAKSLQITVRYIFPVDFKISNS